MPVSFLTEDQRNHYGHCIGALTDKELACFCMTLRPSPIARVARASCLWYDAFHLQWKALTYVS